MKKNVYLIETMEKYSDEKLLHLSAIYFIRPTDDNMNKLIKEIKDPRFREYNICKHNDKYALKLIFCQKSWAMR